MFSKFYIPTYTTALIIFILSIMPGKDLPYFTIWDIIGIDKIAHLAVYLTLSVCIAYGMFNTQKFFSDKKVLIISMLIATFYGGLIEIIQGLFFYDRYADIVDFIFNTMGAFLGAYFYKRIMKIKVLKSLEEKFQKIFSNT